MDSLLIQFSQRIGGSSHESVYVRPAGKVLKEYRRNFFKPRDGLTKSGTLLYFARKRDCDACALKSKCCPNMPARKILRSIHEAARDKARAIAKTEAYAVSRRGAHAHKCA